MSTQRPKSSRHSFFISKNKLHEASMFIGGDVPFNRVNQFANPDSKEPIDFNKKSSSQLARRSLLF